MWEQNDTTNYYRKKLAEVKRQQEEKVLTSEDPNAKKNFRRYLEYTDVTPSALEFWDEEDYLSTLHSLMDVALLGGDVTWAKELHTKIVHITQSEGADFT